jgi:hypothetical protein
MPRDSRIHLLSPSKNGEHQYAAYCEEHDEDYTYKPFWDSENIKIKNFFAVPSFKEILELDL